jgi:hypothetical protein
LCKNITYPSPCQRIRRNVFPKVNILIRGVEFIANLIVLESKGIDVILGMDWLSNHKGMINCAKKAVRLTTSSGKKWNMWQRT